jgi:hypothetical protein
MSEEKVKTIRRIYEYYSATGDFAGRHGEYPRGQRSRRVPLPPRRLRAPVGRLHVLLRHRLLRQPGGFEVGDEADCYLPTPSGTMRTPRSYQLPTGTSAISTSVSLRKLSPLTPTTA